MNTPSRPEPDDTALRRTAAALGEPVDTGAPDDAARAESEATRALAEALRAAYRREPMPFVNPALIAQRATGEASDAPARRRASGRLSGALSGRRSDGGAWTPFAVAAAACVALAMVAFYHRPAERVSVARATEESPAPGTIQLATRGATVASLASTMPGLSDAGAAFRPAGRAAVALAAPNAKAYADLVRREYAAGRPVAPSRLRLDALVNAYVAGCAHSAPSDRPVQLEAAVVRAPWDDARRVLRVTVRGYGRAGETVATRLAASVNFDAGAVRGWRILGHEGAAGFRSAPAIAGGDAVTTLYEIEPVANVAPGALLASVTLGYTASGRQGRVETPVPVAAVTDFARGDADTRFAVALAAYAQNRMADAGAVLSACAGEHAERRDFAAALIRR